MCGSKRVCAVVHVLWCLVYIGTGTIQLVAGIFFLVTLPIFKTGSNIWVGSWNILAGITCTIVSCVGDLNAKKQETLLFCTFSILAVNVINLVLLEVGEWHYYMTDSMAELIAQKNLRRLIYFAHMTTSLSTAVAIITAFLDSQFTYCSMQRTKERSNLHEQVSDIEYIIPRTKSRSVAKQAHNIYNQYAQSWVFESDTTASSSKVESPYLKLPSLSQYDAKKTITIRTHTSTHLDIEDVELTPEHSTKVLLVKPTVHVEPVSDDSAGGRSLNYMKSFSRTPSPANMSDSSSPDSSLNPPIYECLERLTEPGIYRSRLNTAISLTNEKPAPLSVHRSSFSGRKRQYSAHASPLHMDAGALVRPRSEIISGPGNRLCLVECIDPTDKVQYASLMAELQLAFKSNKDKFLQTFSPETVSGSDKTHSESDSQATEKKGSDTEFSKELEAALQLIQDLESPNTVDTPSDPCRSNEVGGGVLPGGGGVVCVRWRESENNSESTKTLSECVSPSDFPEETTTVVPSPHGKRLSLVMLAGGSQSSSGYSSPSAGTSKHQTPLCSQTPSVSSSSSNLIITSQAQIAYAIHNRGSSAIISLFCPKSDQSSPTESTTSTLRISLPVSSHSSTLEKHNSFNNKNTKNEVIADEGRLDKPDIPFKDKDNVLEGLASSQNPSRWSVLTKQKKKPKLAPELEGAIFKPESLVYLSDIELIARHERNKSVHREIEQRVLQQIYGVVPTESNC